MVISIWLVLRQVLRAARSGKPAPVYHKIWADDGSRIDPLVVQAIRSI